MDALVAAAKKEGTLNTIALPRDWANYGAMIDGFEKKYGIKVNSGEPGRLQPGRDQRREVAQGPGPRPRRRRPGQLLRAAAAPSRTCSRRTRSPTWDKIPDGQKDPRGRWYNDYGGYISIGCDAKRVKTCPTTFADLLKPEYKGKVALNGNPTKSGSAFGGVYAAALANGGSFDDIQPGIDFFAELSKNGNFTRSSPPRPPIVKGGTPIIIDWDYLNAGYTDEFKSKGVDWQVAVPADGVLAEYYSQAINKDAPHPAAARLWQEYLYSAEGQNLWLQGLRPPGPDGRHGEERHARQGGGRQAAEGLGTPSFPSEAQLGHAKDDIAEGWGKPAPR